MENHGTILIKTIKGNENIETIIRHKDKEDNRRALRQWRKSLKRNQINKIIEIKELHQNHRLLIESSTSERKNELVNS